MVLENEQAVLAFAFAADARTDDLGETVNIERFHAEADSMYWRIWSVTARRERALHLRSRLKSRPIFSRPRSDG